MLCCVLREQKDIVEERPREAVDPVVFVVSQRRKCEREQNNKTVNNILPLSDPKLAKEMGFTYFKVTAHRTRNGAKLTEVCYHTPQNTQHYNTTQHNTTQHNTKHNTQHNTTQHTTTQSLEELLSLCDVVSIHCPLLPSTHHMFNTERLEHIKVIPTAFCCCFFFFFFFFFFLL